VAARNPMPNWTVDRSTGFATRGPATRP
jgi:hypothetical protein